MKLEDFDLRSNFTFPVYFGTELKEIDSEIKSIDWNHRNAAQLTRKNGITYLDLSVVPTKDDFQNKSFIVNDEDKVTSQEDNGDWYATTWSGDILFVLHKYIRIGINDTFSFNKVTHGTSKWIISDFDIVNQFMLNSDIYQTKIYVDYIRLWFNIYHPDQDLSKLDSIIIDDLVFDSVKFTMKIRGERHENMNSHSMKRYVDLCIVLNFDNLKRREKAYRIAVLIRNMFQIFIGKKIGIYKIILNRDESWDKNTKKLRRKDERANWFIQQSFLPESVNERAINFNVNYDEIKADFKKIVSEYFKDTKLQALISAFLTVNHYDIPVRTAIITLISGVESYYNEAHFNNGKKIKNALKKLQRFISLENEAQQIINGVSSNIIIDIDDLLKILVDNRDFYVHGDKVDKALSEIELIPYLMKFLCLYERILCDLLTLKVKKNN